MDVCAAVLRDLYAYRDGTLPPLRQAEVERHLAEWLACGPAAAEARRRRGAP